MDPIDNSTSSAAAAAAAGASASGASATAAVKARPVVADFSDAQFDFASYIAGYSGIAKVIKCKFIAERVPKLAVRGESQIPFFFFFFFFFAQVCTLFL
jgi:hypothetical protein